MADNVPALKSKVGFSLPTDHEMKVITTLAQQAGKLGYFDKMMKNGGLAVPTLMMLTAREYDIPPMQALFGGLQNIDGKIEMSPHMMNAKIRQGGHSLQVEFGKDEENGFFCKITGRRKDNGDSLSVVYGMQHAQLAGLTNKENWKKNPREMCYCRAMGRVGRMLFADILGSAYATGEVIEESSDNEEILEDVTQEEPITLEAFCPAEDANNSLEINPAKLRNFREKWVLKHEGDIDAAEKARLENPKEYWSAFEKFCREEGADGK